MTTRDREIQRIRERCRELLRRQSLAGWRSRTTGASRDTRSIYHRFDSLFTPVTLDQVRSARDAADGDERRALDYLLAYLNQEVVYAAGAEADDALSDRLTEVTVEFDGRVFPYHDLGALMAREGDAERRRTLSDATLPVLRDLNPLAERKLAVHTRTARSLEFGSYRGLSERIRLASVDHLCVMGGDFLDATEECFHAALAWAVPEQLGMSVDCVRRCDLPRLARSHLHDSAFRREALIPAAESVVKGLGLTPGAFTVDDADHPKKSPRAACYPIEIPGDVRVSIKPQGGREDWAAYFHEMGHALHFAHTRRPEFEFQILGSSAATETYAFLIESLLDHPAFLRGRLGINARRADHIARFGAFARLFMVRRYCAKLLFERDLHSAVNDGCVDDARESYRRHLSRAYGFTMTHDDAERYLLDVDDFFYSADYLNAWFLGARLEQKLVERFGEGWYDVRDAGAWLAELWAEGSRLSPDELAKALGLAAVSPEPLIALLRDQVSAAYESFV